MANTSTPYFNSPKFDLTEWAQLITLWMAFMFKGLTATLYSIADWVEEQITTQMGDLHEPNRKYSDPVDPVEPVTIEPVTLTIEPVTIEPEPVTLTYKDLQAMLRQYRDSRGEIQVKLNAKKSKLLEECRRLGLTA